MFVSGLEVFDGGLVVVLQGDEPFRLQLEGALELFVRLGLEQGILGGQTALAELLHEAK